MDSSAPKIVFLIRALTIGGAERQLVELACALHRAGWKVTVATFYPGGPLSPTLTEAGVRLVSLGKQGRWHVFSFAWRLARVLRAECPDLVHGYLDMANLLLVLLRPFLSNASVVWGVRASNMDLTRYDLMWRITYRMSARLSRFTDLILCNSEAGRAYHIGQGYCSERMVVIPNGIDLQRFRPDADARREVRAEWRVDPSERLVGLVARLELMKDHPTFLRAAARLITDNPDIRFVCVGDGPRKYRDALAALAASLGLRDRLIWAGPRLDIQRIYNALDLVVCSSAFGEGFPNVIAEAMATGVPCVVTDVGDAAKVVGDLGWVCPPRNSFALSQAMLGALRRLPRDETKLRETIRTRYSSNALFERTAAELRGLISHAVPGSQPRAGTTL